MTETLYRYESVGTPPDAISIQLLRFAVDRTTPKGYWILLWSGPKFVLAGDGKRYAHETVEWARGAFLRRKESYRKHLQAKLSGVEATLALISEGNWEGYYFQENEKYTRFEEAGTLLIGDFR